MGTFRKGPAARPGRTTGAKVEAAVVRSEKGERIVSSSRFAALTGFDRGTLKGWVDKGCPTEGRGSKGEVLVDIRSVWKWREDRVREEALKDARVDEPVLLGGAPMTPGDILKLEQVKLTRLKIAREAEILVPRELVEYVIERLFGVVRQAVLGVPERIFRKMSGIPEERKLGWYLDAQKQCRAALEAGAQAVTIVFSDMEDRLAAALPPLDDIPEPKADGE